VARDVVDATFGKFIITAQTYSLRHSNHITVASRTVVLHLNRSKRGYVCFPAVIPELLIMDSWYCSTDVAHELQERVDQVELTR
jgi:hypothetical protein